VPYCPDCGVEISKEHKFCPMCGTRLVSAPPTQMPTPPPKPARAPEKIAPTRAAVIGRGKLITAVVTIVAIVVALGWYFLAGRGGSRASIVMQASVRVGEEFNAILYVTNGESSQMTVSSIKIDYYSNDQLGGSETVSSGGYGWITGTVPVGSTVAIWEGHGFGPFRSENIGTKLRFEITCYTNFGELKTTNTTTITA
jgi:hypothetical protein